MGLFHVFICVNIAYFFGFTVILWLVHGGFYGLVYCFHGEFMVMLVDHMHVWNECILEKQEKTQQVYWFNS